MADRKKAPSDKTVFVIESDQERKDEIKESMSHQSHWTFRFFNEASEAIVQVKTDKPLALFLDIEHFDKKNDENIGFSLIDRIKEASPDTEVIVFSNSDNEKWAAESLRHGALDYIMFNPHQYLKMEYELQWLETVKDKQKEDRIFIRRMIYMLVGLVLFIILMTILYEMGILKEGTETDIFLGP